MARPERNDVDYFPHEATHGKKMFYICNKYGNDGYSTWFIILEKLCRAKYHYLDLKKDADMMYMTAECRVSEERFKSIVSDLVKLGAFHAELWEKHSIIWCQKFIDSIQDAYRKRNNKCITLEGLLRHIDIKLRPKPTSKGENSAIKPQSKVKDSKEEDINTFTFENFINAFNRISGRGFRGDTKSKRNFTNLLKAGYKPEDFERAVRNLYASEYHKESNFQYATPELLTRPEKFEMFLNTKQPEREKFGIDSMAIPGMNTPNGYE